MPKGIMADTWVVFQGRGAEHSTAIKSSFAESVIIKTYLHACNRKRERKNIAPFFYYN